MGWFQICIEIVSFCLYNYAEMEKWIKIYEEERAKKEEDQREQQSKNRGRPFPSNLEKMPTKYSIEWLGGAIEDAIQRGEIVTVTKEEFAMGTSTTISKIFLAFVSSLNVYAIRNHMCSYAHSMQCGHIIIIFAWRNLM